MNPKFKLTISPHQLSGMKPVRSAESNQDRESVETELMFFGRAKNLDDLSGASAVEIQEQLEGAFQNGTRCRARMTKAPGNGAKRYQMTMKIPRESEHGVKSVTEHTVDIDYDFFEAFRGASHRCVKKVRAKFPTQKVELKMRVEGQDRIITGPELFYEVDIFKDKQGEAYEWVKIDLELDALLAFAERELPGMTITFDVDLSRIPLDLYDVFDGKDPTKKDIIDQLWADVVLNPQNPEV